MEFKKVDKNSYESDDIEKSYSKKLEETIRLIYNYPNVKINALMYELEGNSHDESWLKVYDVFEPGEWNNFLEEVRNEKQELYKAKPIIREHLNFDEFDLTEWASYHNGWILICASGEENYRDVYIEYNGIAKRIRIMKAFRKESKYMKIVVYDK